MAEKDLEYTAGLVEGRLQALESFKDEVKADLKALREQGERVERSLHTYKAVMRFAMGVSSVLGAIAAFVVDFLFRK